MTDRERVEQALREAGFRPNLDQDGVVWEREYGLCYESVSFGRERARIWLNVPVAEVPYHLCPLTLEMVEKAADEVWSEFKAREDLSVEARDAGIVALERLEALLRQQMGGNSDA